MSQHFRLGLLLALLTLLSLARVCGNDFIDLDDNVYVTENPHVQAGLTGDGVRWAFKTTDGNFWHPITWLSLQLDATLYGHSTAWGFHLTNLLLHLANVLILYRVLVWMTQEPWRCFCVAALFAVHPLHVESVAWVAERKDVLSALFWLLGMAAYAWYAARPGWRRMLLVLLPFALGLMTKPMLVTFPFALLLLDVWPLRRWPGTRAGWLLAEKLPLFLLSVAASAWTFAIKRHLGEVVPLPLSDRLANAVISYGWYLLKTFLPTHLGAFYPHPFSDWSGAALAASAAALTAVTTACVRLRRRLYLPVGWLWFVGTLLPVIGLVQVGEQARADRFVYLPHIGLFLAVVWSAADLARSRDWSPALVGTATAAALTILAALSWAQAGHWKDRFTLWEHTTAVTAQNHRALALLGLAYSKMDHAFDLERACECLTESLYIREGVAENHYNLAVTLSRLGRSGEAITHYRRALQLRPGWADAGNNLGYLLLAQGQVDEAIDQFNRVLEKEPEAEGAHVNLGLALLQKGRVDDALSHFQRALQIKPDYPQAHNQAGVALLKRGRPAVAERHFRCALELKPDYPAAAHFLGVALARQGQWGEAIALLKRAAPFDPQYRRKLAYALYQKGDREAAQDQYTQLTLHQSDWQAEVSAEAVRLATNTEAGLRDPQEALELALTACQASDFQDPRLLDALAIAQAARGDFAAARKTSTDALARAQGQPELTRQIEERLRMYEKGRPAPPAPSGW